MAVWSERHVMQLEEAFKASSHTLADCLIKVYWPSKDFKQEIYIKKIISSEHGLSLSVVAALMVSYFRLIARESKPRTLVVCHHRSLCRRSEERRGGKECR